MSAPAHETVIKITGLKKTFKDLTAVDNISFEAFKGEIFGLPGPNGAGKTTTINMICGLLPATAGEIDFQSGELKEIKSFIGYCPQENIYFPKLTCSGQLILDEPEAGLDPQSRILVRNFIKSLSEEKTIILTSHNMDEVDRLAHRVAIMDYGKIRLMFTATIAVVAEFVGITSILLTLLTAIIPGFDYHGSAALFILVAVLTSVSIIAFRLIIAALTKTANEVLIVGNFPLFLFMFFTGAASPFRSEGLFSLFGYPVTLQGLMSPTHAISALNKILICQMKLVDILPEIVALIILTVLYFFTGMILFRKRHMTLK